MKAYKIMKISDQENSWKTLFHGVGGDRNIKCNQWIVADTKYVREHARSPVFLAKTIKLGKEALPC